MDEKKSFSVLERYGNDITKEAYITNPAIGREKQIKELILILLTPEKSAILIGKPGIGKTAIVEGLAYKMQQGEVPDALKGYTIINIKTASLLGTMPDGESKVQIMIDELKTRDKVILFVDEVHMLIGATDSSSLDFANIFKEGLGRGSIKVIGATTTEEYERYILRDKAFTRRFQKVEVPEPTRDETVQIMMGTLPKIEKTTGRKMKYTHFQQGLIMGFIVDCTTEYKRVYAIGSRYPDIALTIMKQAFSYAVFDNREWVDIFDYRKALENSKNIYPDVIKKELPKFDQLFKDIVKMENGEVTDLDFQLGSVPGVDIKANELVAEVEDEIQPVSAMEPIAVIKPLQKPMTIGNARIVNINNNENKVHFASSEELDHVILSSTINTLQKKVKPVEQVIVPELDPFLPPKLENGFDYIEYEKYLKAVPVIDPYDDGKKRGWKFIQEMDNVETSIKDDHNIKPSIKEPVDLTLKDKADNSLDDDFFDE